MTAEVLLTVTGEQTGADGQNEKNVTVNSAVYEQHRGIHRLFYTETDPESGEQTQSVLQFSEKALVISRSGEVQTSMRLIVGRVTGCQYRTPYGVLDMRLDTKQITLLESEDRIEACVVYDLQIGGGDFAPIRSRVTAEVVPQ